MRTLVHGLGESGIAATRALAERGDEVIVTDAGDPERLRSLALSLGVVGRSGASPSLLDEGFDRIVASPGIRPRDALLAAAEERGVPILSEVTLGLDLLRDEAPGVRVVAVTGTNGKTTVVDMIGAILREASVPHATAGNSWRALTGCLDEVRQAGLLVLEVSSFQLHYLNEPGFEVAALLNVRPDHLNWHASLEEYAADKLRVFDGQGPGDLALVSAADPVGTEVAGNLHAETLIVGEGETGIVGGRLRLRGEELEAVEELPFLGVHNHENALFAAAATERVGVSLGSIRAALRGYEPKPHRMRVVGERGGVVYVDDSKATNPAAVAAALGSFERPVVLILGGSDKGTDFAEVLPGLSRCRAVVCQGEAGTRIHDFLKESAADTEVQRVPDLAAAVVEAGELAQPGDVVLLSPGCASFDQFASYGERGEAFAGLVAALGAGLARGGAGR